MCSVLARWFARAHHLVNLIQRFQFTRRRINAQRVGNVGPLIKIIDIQNLDILQIALAQALQQLFCDLGIGIKQHFAAVFIDNVTGNDASDQVVIGQLQCLHFGFLHLLDMAHGDALAGSDNQLVLAGGDVGQSAFTTHALRHDFNLDVFFAQGDAGELEKGLQDLLGVHAQRAQQDGHRQFAATIDTGKNAVFGIKFKIQPGAAIRDHPGRKQQFAGRMAFALVMIKKDPGRTMHLADDDTLGTIDNESAVFGHQGNFAHVDFLLLDLFRLAVFRWRILVEDDQAHHDFQCRTVRCAALLTLTHVKYRLFQSVADILQHSVVVIADDREYRCQGTMQTITTEVVCIGLKLEEFIVGFNLSFQQIGNIEHALIAAEVLANTFLFSE